MAGAFTLPKEYWSTIEITPQDIENLHTQLFERETPLTAHDLALALIEARIQTERSSTEIKQYAGGKSYIPKQKYLIGDEVVIPSLGWRHGKVSSIRPGSNPAVSSFDVITIILDGGSERMFAANLESHLLNEAPPPVPVAVK